MSNNELTASVNKPSDAGNNTAPVYYSNGVFTAITTKTGKATQDNGSTIATEGCVKATADAAQSAAQSYTDGKFV